MLRFYRVIPSHPTPKWHEFYHRFAQSITNGPLRDENLLDSLRKVIFGYACSSLSWGSLTRDPHIDKTGGQNLDFRVKYRLPDEESCGSCSMESCETSAKFSFMY